MKKTLSVILALTFIICMLQPISAMALTYDKEIPFGFTEEIDYSSSQFTNIYSSNESVAKAYAKKDGSLYYLYVTGVSEGTATITYNEGYSYSYTYNITVTKSNIKNITLSVGEYKLVVKEDDYDYDEDGVSNFTSSDTAIAKDFFERFYDEDEWETYYYYYAFGVSAGTTTMTYRYNNKPYLVYVTVTEPKAKTISIPAGGYKTLAVDKYKTQTDQVSNVVSSNKSIVKIETKNTSLEDEDHYYYVYGVATGSTTVSYKFNGTTYKAKVNVVKPTFSSPIKSLSLNTRDDHDDYYVYYNALSGLKVTSSNTKVATATIDNYTFSDARQKYFISEHTENGKLVHFLHFNLKKKGTATLTVSDKYGHKAQIKLTVKDGLTYDNLKKYSKNYSLNYGETKLYGETLENASVKLKLGGKTYKTKADSEGFFTFKKIKVCKIGAKFTVTYTSKGISYSKSGKIKKPETPYLWHYWYYRNQKTFSGYVKNVHKGDVIKITIGNKTYKKKVTKNVSGSTKYKYKFNVTPNGNYGSKIKLQVVNKFGQSLRYYTDIIYYSKNLSTGMTKKQAKCVPGWEYPDEKHYYSDGEYWWYDDDGDGYASDSYLYFVNGRLRDWMY